MWSLALAGARAHRTSLSGTALVLATAGALVSLVGVFFESGSRAGAGVEGGTLVALASSYSGIALVVVVMVVAAMVTLALRARRREFALMRTVGATRGQVRQQVSFELLLVALVAVPVGAALGVLLARRFDPLLQDAGMLSPGSQLSLSPLPVLAAVALLVPTAMLAGRLATRETLRIPPTDAVRSSAVETPRIGPIRKIFALLTAVAGLAVAFTPLWVPGSVGGETAGLSAFFLIGAVALAGPLLVARTFGRTVLLAGARTGAPTRLALHNVRGFSRRLTTVIVPLALALSVGTIQTSVNSALGQASEQQLRAAVTSDLVLTGALSAASQLTAVPAVAEVAPLAEVPVEVRDEDDAGTPDSLVWESTRALTVPPDVPQGVFDPGVTDGSLAALSAPDTVAISSDAASLLGFGMGDSLTVRYDGAEHRLEVVAVYERGLGVGGYLMAPETATSLGSDATPSTLLVTTTDDATTAQTADRIRDLGYTVQSPAQYAAGATSPDAAEQQLSTLLLLLLLVFIVLGAVNALVLTTAGRHAELVLLHRTGTTRRQLSRMLLVESLLTGVLAWLIGTAAVVPAVLGVSAGLLPGQVPVVDLTTYVLLSLAVVVTAVGATTATAAWAVRRATG
ncbi:FtsX-like permease family protein [Paractinoplanes maris]|uniref:FtsX-like permease family protein n=1 Tax=Paractinoplanes maris TaxID=1734446 RepID=UPI0020201EC7|nr:FtsX-like permease family protein [Actinoplanes maris]